MPTSGRYQSRFFSFLSEQSLRLRDKTGQTWRQMKLATAWGVQIVLYPVYLAFQSARLVSRQLQQTARRVLPQLQAVNEPLPVPDQASEAQHTLAADTPIRNILGTIAPLVQALPSPATTEQLPSTPTNAIDPSLYAPAHPPQTPLSSPLPTIQAIASLLDSHHLVLVTPENQILDIFTTEQQSHLQRRIIGEIATYWQQRRSLAGAPVISNFLPLPSDRPNAVLPIRAFYRLMTWMQTSSIAIAANLFQESRLATLHTLATAPTAALPAAEQSALRSAEVSWLSLQDAFRGLFARSPQSAPSPAKSLKARLRDWWQTDRAALVHLPTADSPIDGSPVADSPLSSQSWLTWEDLFGSRSPAKSNSDSDWELFEPPNPQERPVQRKNSTGKRLTGKRADRSSTSSMTSPNLGTAQPIVLATEDTATLTVPETQPEANALSNTWIEAEVSLVKYEKHPLEQLLEWLDRSMLWLEEKIAHTLQWLRDRLGSGKDSK